MSRIEHKDEDGRGVVITDTASFSELEHVLQFGFESSYDWSVSCPVTLTGLLLRHDVSFLQNNAGVFTASGGDVIGALGAKSTGVTAFDASPHVGIADAAVKGLMIRQYDLVKKTLLDEYHSSEFQQWLARARQRQGMSKHVLANGCLYDKRDEDIIASCLGLEKEARKLLLRTQASDVELVRSACETDRNVSLGEDLAFAFSVSAMLRGIGHQVIRAPFADIGHSHPLRERIALIGEDVQSDCQDPPLNSLLLSHFLLAYARTFKNKNEALRAYAEGLSALRGRTFQKRIEEAQDEDRILSLLLDRCVACGLDEKAKSTVTKHTGWISTATSTVALGGMLALGHNAPLAALAMTFARSAGEYMAKEVISGRRVIEKSYRRIRKQAVNCRWPPKPTEL